METINDNLYNYPKYYDLLFGSDWKAEYDFLEAVFEKHAKRPVKRLFEPACGTGRLLIKFAQAGYEVAGNDLNPKAIDYCNDRLQRAGFPRSAMVGDMSDFKLGEKVDAAFNTINSFRHLQTEEQAQGHLQCIADSLNSGGLYVLGFHLTPTEGDPVDEESWTARKGHLAVASRMWSIKKDMDARKETVNMMLDVFTPTKSFRLLDEIVFRIYLAEHTEELFATVPELELVETYDFAYDIDDPITIDNETEDVVYILRKK
ncbi:MAG: class I SAM-dependent methyltransferase [Planctomycetia bacterium]|jgi:SAM-dependent methyltransferase